MNLRIKFIVFFLFLFLMFALAITSVTFFVCKGFFTKIVQIEVDVSFKSFLSSYESSIKLEKEKSSLNSIFDAFGPGTVYASFVSVSDEVFFVGQENILGSEIYKYSSSVTAADGNTVGTLSVGFYKDYYYSQARKSFNVVLKNILFVATGCIILSVFAIFFISKWFAKSFEDSEKRFKDDFLVSVSHEFKSPLAAIEGYSDLMLEKSKNNSYQGIVEGLNVIKNSTDRLKYFVSNVLSLADIRAGKVKAKGISCYIDEVIEEETRKFKSVADLEKKKFIIDITEGLPPVSASAGMLGLAVSCILSNAFKFTKEGDTVSVRAMLSRDYGSKFVEVWISDTGIGISKELLKRIFEKFYQVKKNKFEKLKGSGLGLSLASEVIALYRGNIWAESQVGKGTEIKFIVPALKLV